nr:hypothetical protein [uncultured Duganella sp.]
MSSPHQNVLLILDDRELASGDVRSVVGARRYGDILFQRRKLVDHFRASLPAWAAGRLLHLRGADDLPSLRAALEASGEDSSVCVIAGRAGFAESQRLYQLIERLPYAEEDFTDRLYKPLLVFLRNAHRLVEQWPALTAAPLHTWEQAWHGSQRVESVQPLDLAQMRDFLLFISGATATRHFNQVEVDPYYYTKSSADVAKMRAEYAFYGLAPESMRPWLIQPFDYQEKDGRASYRMLRYYLADAALQWVHGAFDAATFDSFVERMLFFMAERPRRACTKAESAASARALFVTKLERRAEQFLASEAGRRVDALAAAAAPHLALSAQLERFRRLYEWHEKSFAFEHTVVGHGDPCFSNVLYDQQRYLLQLIDPRGATTEAALWTHPLYDLCKLSHSALGDYDFINNSLYRIGFDDHNAPQLHFEHSNHATLKTIFQRRLKAQGHDERIVRLGEASLFLSMLPLHLDVPNKAFAFLLKANTILDQVEKP